MEKNHRPALKMGPVVMDCGAGFAGILARFYSELLGWELSHPPQNGTAAITSSEDAVLAFQETAHYEQPVWPWRAGAQGQMLHFDLLVKNLEEGIAYAVSLGATLAEPAYFDDSRTLLDPAGHPFCIDVEPAESKT